MTWPQISPADVIWKKDNTPESKKFGDIYHLPGQGMEEKSYVFLDGIGLDEHLKTHKSIAIGEAGFGIGLNFLLSWAQWKHAPARSRLDYASVEGFPMSRNDLARALKPYKALAPLANQLIAQWPPIVPGFHRLAFEDGRVTLMLVFGDVADAPSQIEGTFNAWYLDGFSPDKNPGMWSHDIFKHIARLSAKDARVATYTAAGHVRRGLEMAGFEVSKRDGFDKKRHSLTGVLRDGKEQLGLRPGANIAVVGGGIAGCSAAHALEKKAFEVTLFEKENRLAAGTSGHPLAVFEPKLQKTYHPYSAFFLAAYLYSLRHYENLETDGIWHPARGTHHYTADKQELQRLEELAGLFPGLEDHLELAPDGLRFPRGGCLVPHALCQALTRDVDVRLGQAWQDDNGFDAVVMANGHRAFDGWGENPFRLTRGQINYLPSGKTGPDHTLSFAGGYLTPESDEGFHVLGTSFEEVKNPDRGWAALSQENLETNLAGLEEAAPELAKQWKNAPLKGRVALRAETVDHLPVVGPAFDSEKLQAVFKEKQRLHHTQRQIGDEADIKGLYVLAGFASRGFTAAPYAAEILTSQMAGTPLPCPSFVRKALNPSRFQLKKLKAS